MSIKIKKIDFNDKNDSRILESALSNWFKDPKELNLVEPRLHYPFNFKKWNFSLSVMLLLKNRSFYLPVCFLKLLY